MYAIGLAPSRFPAACAILFGAAILAGGASAHAGPVPDLDNTTLAIPRTASDGAAGVALPQPLPAGEAARIRRIFRLQSLGALEKAEQETARLDLHSPLVQAMLGHILADRYLGPFTHSTAEQLQGWLSRFSDLPDAPAIRSLLEVRSPRGARIGSPASERPLVRNPALDSSVHAAARSHRPFAALHLLAHTRGLTPVYAGLLKGEAAQILFAYNHDEEAYDTAVSAIGGCRKRVPEGCADVALPEYVAGLAAWRMGRVAVARERFIAAWHAGITDPWQRAAAAFWAARAEARSGRGEYVRWMRQAAIETRTFYGILARRVLGLDVRPERGQRKVLAEADIEAVAATPEGERACALLQVGEPARAAAELQGLWAAAQDDPALARAVALVAERAGLAEVAKMFTEVARAADWRPGPALQPVGGFSVDPAMIYGLARAESNFDARMLSPAGARGILQIMPDTAHFVLYGNGSGPRMPLYDPAVNLAIGQRYVNYLAAHAAVDGDLIRLLASWNTGPNAFARWSGEVHDLGDPLLFLEAIPIDETRSFIPHVLAYTWIYAAQMGLPTPSLYELASGEWPRYDVLREASARMH